MFNVKSVLVGVALAAVLAVPAALVAGGTSEGSKPQPLPQGKTWNTKSAAIEWAQFKGRVTLIDYWNHR